MTITTFNLNDPDVIANPYPHYAWLRESAPVHRGTDPDLWYVSRHDEVQAILRDPATFASDVRAVTKRLHGSPFNPSLKVPRPVGALLGRLSVLRILLTSDPPEHTSLRRRVSRAFTPRMMAAWEDRIEAIADELMTELVEVGRSGPVDLVAGLASPLPTTVIAEMMGVPAERHADFKRWSDRLVDGLLTGGSIRRLATSAVEISAFFARTVRERRRDPGDDLISLLVTGDPDDALSAPELVAFSVLLLVAGNETTTNLISSAVLALDAHPAERERVVADPRLAGRVVEETLRWDGPAQGLIRATTRDVTIHGVAIPARSVVMPLVGSANRDPDRWLDADRFDLDREPNDHLTFGTGIHYCIGQALARLEARAALEAIYTRAPELQISGDPVRIASPVLRGLRHLPVSLTRPA